MSWNISELDKNKTKQCISNETIRLGNCKVIFEKLNRDYKHMCIKHENEELKLAGQIENIKRSIESGERFIEECQAHLKDLENAETN